MKIKKKKVFEENAKLQAGIDVCQLMWKIIYNEKKIRSGKPFQM